MYESSTLDQPQIIRYTKDMQAKKRKERKYIVEFASMPKTKIPISPGPEVKPSLFPRCFTSTLDCIRFIIQRSRPAPLLCHHYSDTTGLPVQKVNANLFIES
jgi:hypothetical protein